MKRSIIIILIIVLFALSVQIYFMFKEKNKLRDKFESLSAKSGNLIEENNKIKSDIEYFSNQTNLEKELRANFNYKNIGEKMMIVVP